jgi:hypothetical protein
LVCGEPTDELGGSVGRRILLVTSVLEIGVGEGAAARTDAAGSVQNLDTAVGPVELIAIAR